MGEGEARVFEKLVPLRLNLMYLGHGFQFQEAGWMVSKPQFLYPSDGNRVL